MPLFDFRTGVTFKKTGREVKDAIEQRVVELRIRLGKRDRELDEVLSNKARVPLS